MPSLCVWFCAFLSGVGLYIHHHHEDKELFHHQKVLSYPPIITKFISFLNQWQPLITSLFHNFVIYYINSTMYISSKCPTQVHKQSLCPQGRRYCGTLNRTLWERSLPREGMPSKGIVESWSLSLSASCFMIVLLALTCTSITSICCPHPSPNQWAS